MRAGQPVTVTVHIDAFDRDYDGSVEQLPGAAGTLFSLLPITACARACRSKHASA